jgi:hypothetical protein
LIDVREQRRESCFATLLERQREAEAKAQAAASADRGVDAAVDAQDRLWRSARQALAAGGCVEDLRAASLWNQSLVGHIAAARAQAARARDEAARQQQVADLARRALVQAAARVEKARTVQGREARAAARRTRQRDEEVACDRAVQAWQFDERAERDGLA